MILDSIDEIKNKKYDVCIIGSGPAGITTALNLASTVKVLIVEAGDVHYSPKSQEYYSGEVVGDKYFDLRICRLRQIGGSSGHWAGKCSVLDDFDYEFKKYAPEANWPIRKTDLDKYLEKASSILQIGSNFKGEGNVWDTDVVTLPFKYSPPVRFKDQYLDFIAKSKNIDLIANTALCSAQLSDSSIKKLVLSNASGDKVGIKSNKYIFAMGGIENGRMLKFIATDNPSSSLSKNKNVGAYWMEHPHFVVGDIFYEKPTDGRWHVGISAQKKRKLEVLNCNLHIVPHIDHPSDTKTIELLRDLLCANETIGTEVSLRIGKNYCGGLIEAAWEQEPRFENRIDLSSEVDFFGVPKVVLRWEKSELDLRTIRLTSEYVAESMVKNKQAKVRLREWLWSGKYPESDDVIAGSHHLGGTRMSKTKNSGVVDSNLRSWDVSNLFIVGSSVFPSGGHANPTLTIVQLAARLADHLMKKI